MTKRAGAAHRGHLRIALFGNLLLSVDGRRIRFAVRPMVVPLLAYLVLKAAQPTPRDELAFALWPDDPEDEARTNLRRHLLYLREALPASTEPFVRADLETVQWNPDAAAAIDVAEFERWVDHRETRAAAVDLYAGDLLASLEHDWLLAPRERLRSQFLGALWELAKDARLRRDGTSAARYLQRLLAADPWREDAVRELMLVRHGTGDRAGAMRTCLEFEQRLYGEMRVGLMPETVALRDALAAGTPLPALPIPHNLPSPPSSFVGRVAEVAEIERRLQAARLVTVVGSGGVGKTRVALHVAAALREAFEDGAWFVDLGAIGDPALAASTIARTLGIRASEADDLKALRGYLASRNLLIVLDNCEHVIEEAARVADAVLRVAPRVRVLATSRQSLRVAGESAYRLPSLTFPVAGSDPSTGELARFDAVALFCARAHAAGEFELRDENSAAVADICRRLDGIPMAIELAAARVKVLAPAELARMLDERLRVLIGGERAAIGRHRTMRALIDWSYDLLSPAEQLLFDRLSVFAGGFTLAAAEAVCTGDGIDAGATFELLSSLVDKSLVVAERGVAATRYTMLESSREYGAERLRDRNEAQTIARRHAEEYLALAERLERSLQPTLDAELLAEIEHEQANWTAALAWSLGAAHDPALGCRLVLARPMWLNWSARPQHWLRLAKRVADETLPAITVGKLAARQAGALIELGEFEACLAELQTAMRIHRETGDTESLASAQRLAGTALVFLGRVAEGEAMIREAADAHRAIGDDEALAYALIALSQARSAAGDATESESLALQALRMLEQNQERLTVTSVLALTGTRMHVADIEFERGNAAGALAYAEQALPVLRAFRHPSVPAYLNATAAYLNDLGRYDEGRGYALESIGLSRDLNAGLVTLYAALHLATGAVLREHDAAEDGAGVRERSARLLGFVEARLAERGTFWWRAERKPFDRARASLAERLGIERLETLTREGAAMAPEGAIEVARSL